ncbi:MAG: outer membrane lipoprotein chaperone LolA [Pseudomonadota bacterium]|nr:outer membrane lipoprotein chaperone LolA [Pseudomonadota bacterium]
MTILAVLGFVMAVAMMPASLASASELQRFYDEVSTLQARFIQRVEDERGRVIEITEGQLWLRRPNLFRWSYDGPNPQIIVSNGRNIQLYDVDLSQVTVRPLDDALSGTPALLLAGGADLEQHFSVTSTGRHDDLDWFELTPRNTETDFRLVRLGLREGRILQMELIDQFGQVTRIRFTAIKVNVDVPASRFELDLPPDVDVVRG